MPIITYIVQAGDSVYSIARRYGVTPRSIIERNNFINPNAIIPGQKLFVFAEETEPPPPPHGTKTYVVYPGDTLYSIAQRTGVTVDQIVRLNNLLNPNYLYPGQRLLLPPEAQLPEIYPNFFLYTIIRGDTLYSIAIRYRTTVDALTSANPGINPFNLRIGQQIFVPTAGMAIPIFQGNIAKKMVALTFDATYGDNQTKKILDILRQNNIRSTWFISGIWAENFPALLDLINMAGHEIGNHSQTHPHMTQLSASEMIIQLINAERLIESVTGGHVDLFRPPFGEYNQTLLNVTSGLGYRTIMWTIDTLDWQNPGSDAILNRVLSNVKNGTIVLMHNSATDTPIALPRIIEELRRRGYSFDSVSEVIDQ